MRGRRTTSSCSRGRRRSRPRAASVPRRSYAATRRLGARAAYYSEWQWARRRFSIAHVDAGDPGPESLLDTGTVAYPVAPTEGPGPFATPEDLLSELLSCLPAHLHETARTVFTGTPVRDLIHAATTRPERKRLRAEYAEIRSTLAALGLWIDPHGSRR